MKFHVPSNASSGSSYMGRVHRSIGKNKMFCLPEYRILPTMTLCKRVGGGRDGNEACSWAHGVSVCGISIAAILS